jgi:hypothetical protein
MVLMCHRGLSVPLWAIALFTVALAAPPPATLPLPPTALLAVALAGIAMLAFAMPGAFHRLRTSRSLARVTRSIHRDEANLSRAPVARVSRCAPG